MKGSQKHVTSRLEKCTGHVGQAVRFVTGQAAVMAEPDRGEKMLFRCAIPVAARAVVSRPRLIPHNSA